VSLALIDLYRSPVLVDFPGFSGQPFDALFLFGSRFGIHLPPEEFLLTQELSAIFEPRQVQCSDAQRRLHCTTWLRLMTAIVKSTLSCQQIDISESLR
jgi:hypothetical protein